MFKDCSQQQTPHAIDKKAPSNDAYICSDFYYVVDVLHDEFSNIISENIIEEAISEADKNGIICSDLQSSPDFKLA